MGSRTDPTVIELRSQPWQTQPFPCVPVKARRQAMEGTVQGESVPCVVQAKRQATGNGPASRGGGRSSFMREDYRRPSVTGPPTASQVIGRVKVPDTAESPRTRRRIPASGVAPTPAGSVRKGKGSVPFSIP